MRKGGAARNENYGYPDWPFLSAPSNQDQLVLNPTITKQQPPQPPPQLQPPPQSLAAAQPPPQSPP